MDLGHAARRARPDGERVGHCVRGQAGSAVDHERDARLALARPGGAGEAQLGDGGLEQGTERLRGAGACAGGGGRGGPPRVGGEARRPLLIRSGTGRGGVRWRRRCGAAAPPRDDEDGGEHGETEEGTGEHQGDDRVAAMTDAWGDRERRWRERTLADARHRAPERRTRFSTISGVEIDALYGPGSWRDLDPARDIGLPGEPPFTRGIHSTGYRSRMWTMRMFAGFGAAEDTNARFRQLLAAGQTGLSIAYDIPTLCGYDTDDPEAEGEFGTCGVAVSSLADMEVLLSGLPLDRVSTSMTINSPAAPIWAVYIAAAAERGFPRAILEGTLPNDILKGL